MLINDIDMLDEFTRKRLSEVRNHLSSCPDLQLIATSDQVENEELQYHGDALRAALEYVEYLLGEHAR